MGYFYRESSYKSNAIGHWASLDKKTGKDNSTEFTDLINAGLEDGSTRATFIKQSRRYGGYGLGQWYSKKYLGALFDFAQSYGADTIADATMQCEFIVWSLQHQTPDLWKKILKLKSPETIGYVIGYIYDGSSAGAGAMGSLAKQVYKKNMPSK